MTDTAKDGAAKLIEEVKTALQVSSIEAAKEALATVELDEPTMRLRIHFRSTVQEGGKERGGPGVGPLRPRAVDEAPHPLPELRALGDSGE